MRSMVEGASPGTALGPRPLHRLSAVPLPRFAGEELTQSSPVACDGGGGTMRSMVEGASPRAVARALPPPMPIGGPPPLAHAGEEPA